MHNCWRFVVCVATVFFLAVPACAKKVEKHHSCCGVVVTHAIVVNVSASEIMGVPVDPADVRDVGDVVFIIVHGDKAREVIKANNGNDLFLTKEGYLVLCVDDNKTPDLEVVGQFHFTILSGRSAEAFMKKYEHELRVDEDTHEIVFAEVPKKVEV